MDKNSIVSVEIKARVSKYGPQTPPKVTVETSIAKDAVELFEEMASRVQIEPRHRHER